MVNRLVSVGDDFTLPAALKVADANLPGASKAAAIAAKADKAETVLKWKANTAYLAGDAVVSPAGDTVTAKANFTSGASYSAANWNLSPTYSTPAAVAAQVPPLVASAIAADGTVAAAAATAAGPAVDAKVAALSLVKTTDPGAPRDAKLSDVTVTAATTDADGRASIIEYSDGMVEIPLAKIGGIPYVIESRDDYIDQLVDVNGRRHELSMSKSGVVNDTVLARWKSRMGVAEPNNPFKVILDAGQSNSKSYISVPVTTEDSDPRLYIWDATAPGLAQMPASHRSMGAYAAREYIKENPNTRVLVVEAGEGSSAFSSTSITPPPAGYTYTAGVGTWDRTLTADPLNLYARMVAQFNAAMTAVKAINPSSVAIAWLWSQGEGDTTALTQAQYAAKLDDLLTQGRVDMSMPETPVVVGSMVPEWVNWYGPAPQREGIQSALTDTPRRLQRTAFVYGPEGLADWSATSPDVAVIHWSPQGQRVRGKLMHDALYRSKLNVATVKPQPPQNIKVTRSGSETTVTWEYPPTRATAFILEYSTDSGATWTAATLGGPVVLKHVMTVAATSAVWVRARSTNELGTSINSREVHA